MGRIEKKINKEVTSIRMNQTTKKQLTAMAKETTYTQTALIEMAIDRLWGDHISGDFKK